MSELIFLLKLLYVICGFAAAGIVVCMIWVVWFYRKMWKQGAVDAARGEHQRTRAHTSAHVHPSAGKPATVDEVNPLDLNIC